ncbi:hypothetical protein H0O00_03345 [Candidatus Micrarchaeota archaeon]|nr:hypothetical protein [Candidatus Micrarchaeota archaeon]
MKHTLPLVLIVIAMIAAGCLSPPQSFGCCLRPNATMQNPSGCVLYNTTDYSEHPEYFDKAVSCNAQSGCNVSIGGNYQMLPICTDDQLVSCVEPNCTAMICGDFAFKPRPMPGFTGIDSAAGDVPVDLNQEGVALQFYKSQCRFLPMDANLKQVMKSSKSQINVFRIGVGGSFDEYDQYRYFFPISDRYCSLNLAAGTRDPATMVDRYMNYLTAKNGQYAPYTGIEKNCIDDTAGSPGKGTPFGFTDKVGKLSYEFNGVSSGNFKSSASGDYQAIEPDKSNYKFTYQARLVKDVFWYVTDYGANYVFGGSGYVDNTTGIYKKMDEAYYRKWLSIAYSDYIYGLTPSETTRAPFECDMSSNDCFSGTCDNSVYSRGVLLAAGPAGEEKEVASDCNYVEDQNGLRVVYCAPTTNVVTSGSGAPKISYAPVPIRVARMNSNFITGNNFLTGLQNNNPFLSYTDILEEDGDQDGASDNQLFRVWDNFTEIYKNIPDENKSISLPGAILTGPEGSAKRAGYTDMINGVSNMNWQEGVYSPDWNDYPLNDTAWNDYPNSTCDLPLTMIPPADFPVDPCKVGGALNRVENSSWGAQPEEESSGPPIGGMVFLGSIDGQYMRWGGADGTDIIGYALATPESLKEMEAYKACGMTEDDFIDVNLEYIETGCFEAGDNLQICKPRYPSDLLWKGLMETFRPYFVNRFVKQGIAAKGFSDGCGKYVRAMDAVLAGMPWVVNYESGWEYGLGDSMVQSQSSYQLASTPGQIFRERNIYDQTMSATPGTESCDIRRASLAMYPSPPNYYDFAYSSHVYLIKKPDDGKLGKCLIDDTGMPKMKTFGWCEPCTTSTLAYQSITAKDHIYLPVATADIGNGTSKDYEDICDYMGYNVSCFNKRITDVGDYKELIGIIGSPRTEPDATILKERMGDYLKSGVMPVINMTNDTNWDIDNPAIEPTLDEMGNVVEVQFDNYLQYDFERLFGSMGAVAVIVDDIGSEADPEKVERIANRTLTLKAFCPRCLAAVHVDSPASNDSFRDIILSITGDARINARLDLITFDYPISDHSGAYAGETGVQNQSQAVADDIASYGMASLSLKTRGKPVMVVGLNVKNSDPTWTGQEAHRILFSAIVGSQDKLVNNGVIGIIYSPAATDSGDLGLVDRRSSPGSKNAKFCALQEAMQLMSTTPSIAMFNKVAAVAGPATVAGSAKCVLCDSLDKANNRCGPSAVPVSALLCDDGTECVLSDGLDENSAKCPDNTVTEDCVLCNETPGTYSCTRTYTNGTKQVMPSESMSVLNSDTYMDVIGGIPKPYKCCLQAGEGDLSVKYTYFKDVHQMPVSTPIAFPTDPNVDCGMGTDIGTLGEISEFCGVTQTPLRNYDITCSITQ